MYSTLLYFRRSLHNSLCSLWIVICSSMSFLWFSVRLPIHVPGFVLSSHLFSSCLSCLVQHPVFSKFTFSVRLSIVGCSLWPTFFVYLRVTLGWSWKRDPSLWQVDWCLQFATFYLSLGYSSHCVVPVLVHHSTKGFCSLLGSLEITQARCLPRFVLSSWNWQFLKVSSALLFRFPHSLLSV